MIEEELFSRALEMPRDERAGFLRRECGEDEALRRRVEELLALHESGPMLIDQPCEEIRNVSSLDWAGGILGESQNRPGGMNDSLWLVLTRFFVK